MKAKLCGVIMAVVYSFPCFSQETTDSTIIEETEDYQPILDYADVEPMFPGGQNALMKFFADSTRYPQEALKNYEQGTVYVQFVVNANGSISQAKIMKGVSPSLDAEALRLISAMPNWIPGQQDGKNIRVRYMVPIKFIMT